MCILIVKPADTTITKRHLREAFRVNSDGAGFMYTENDTVCIEKGFFGFRVFYKTFRERERAYPTSTMVIHMRIATSGYKNTDNCHPFLVHKQVGFAHNGVMSIPTENERSDTRIFVEDVLNKLPRDFHTHNEIMTSIADCATESNSKFVMLLPSNKFVIFNENAGHWRGGCWFSNLSYFLTNYTTDVMGYIEKSQKSKGGGHDSLPNAIIPVSHLEKSSEKEKPSFRDDNFFGKSIPYSNVCVVCSRQDTVVDGICDQCLLDMQGRQTISCPWCSCNNIIDLDMVLTNFQRCIQCHNYIDREDVALSLSLFTPPKGNEYE